jgi:hypothetical protein
MKHLLLFLLTSCATKPTITRTCDRCNLRYNDRIEQCMIKFAERGFDSDGIVKICSKVYQRSK